MRRIPAHPLLNLMPCQICESGRIYFATGVDGGVCAQCECGVASKLVDIEDPKDATGWRKGTEIDADIAKTWNEMMGHIARGKLLDSTQHTKSRL